MENQQTTPAKDWQALPPCKKPREFKDVMAALISSVIVIVTAYMLVGTFAGARGHITIDPKEIKEQKEVFEARRDVEKEAFGRQKDALQFGLSLLSAVLGFYLGRGPAERRAEQAEKTSDTAHANLSTAQKQLQNTDQQRADAEQKVKEAALGVMEVKALIENQRQTTMGGASATQIETLTHAKRICDDLLKKLG